MKLAKPLLCAMAVGFALPLSAFAAPETHEIDAAHSTVGFRIKHLFSHVTGRFDGVQGEIIVDREKPEASSVKVTIDANTINTANEKRDSHLRSADFFEVEKFPTLTYVSKSVKQTGETTADVVGDLTLHGVTKEVPLKVTFLGQGPGMAPGEVKGGWQATGKIKRSDFGLTWGKLVEGTAVVGDDVEINLEVESNVKK